MLREKPVVFPAAEADIPEAVLAWIRGQLPQGAVSSGE
jgi:hypothetical protein